ncbi:MAG: Gfo/Idh/MocA family protein [Luteitalea sp.]
MGERVRVGVVGVGALGRHHARILGDTPGAVLTAVVDVDGARAHETAAQHSAAASFTDSLALIGRVDAATIAAPTLAHFEIAAPLIDAGIHVLIEKPMTTTLAQADDLVGRAAAHGVVLAVGHTERFNPAVDAARPFLTRPRFIEVHRLGTFPDRSLDIDVVFDLMIHDLDVLLSVVDEEVVAVEAVGVPVLTGRVDIANARLKFVGGCIANVTASRISRDRVRKVRFIEPAAYVSVDYASRELEVWRLRKGDGDKPVIEGGPVAVPDAEPLRRELEDFIGAIREGRTARVDGVQGRRALALAQRINDSMTQG